MNIALKDKKNLAWSSTPENIEITRSEGSYLYDSKGNKYLDFIMGWCVGNFGWGNEKIISSLRDFSGPAYVYPSFVYKSWAELGSLLSDIAPGKLSKCFRATGGTDAVETAMKIAMVYTKRKKFLSVEGSYHGNSIGALSIGASSHRDEYMNLLPGCYKIHRPLDEEALEAAEQILEKETVAAFIVEPVLTHPGIHVPSDDFMKEIRNICHKYGTLLVLDEVATGFGRTGKIFGSEHYDLEPDIICLAKAISGGYAAIGATITTQKIGNEVEDKIHAYPTYGWHPLSTQAAIASTRYLIEEKEQILRNVKDLNSLFKERISEMKFKNKVKKSMIGLIIGIDVQDSKYAEEIANKCLRHGLLIEHNENNLVMFPALNMTSADCKKGLDILENCI
jgi:acetylornithine/succinyldiaminopimelate/putrescine aminotransferase